MNIPKTNVTAPMTQIYQFVWNTLDEVFAWSVNNILNGEINTIPRTAK